MRAYCYSDLHVLLSLHLLRVMLMCAYEAGEINFGCLVFGASTLYSFGASTLYSDRFFFFITFLDTK